MAAALRFTQYAFDLSVGSKHVVTGTYTPEPLGADLSLRVAKEDVHPSQPRQNGTLPLDPDGPDTAWAERSSPPGKSSACLRD